MPSTHTASASAWAAGMAMGLLLGAGTRYIWRMIRALFLHNAHTRLPFPGVDSLYRALQAGPDGLGLNPIFYVSSSPWDLYDLLEEFMRVHRIPAGPLFLRAWNFAPHKLLRMRHREHKLALVRNLLDTYPALKWVLIGDSGQHDPEIYREVVRRCPERIIAIYIRDASEADRDAAVRQIVSEARANGVEMVFVEHAVEAAEHAAGQGLIRKEA